MEFFNIEMSQSLLSKTLAELNTEHYEALEAGKIRKAARLKARFTRRIMRETLEKDYGIQF